MLLVRDSLTIPKAEALAWLTMDFTGLAATNTKTKH